jgi:hypothetical protein
MNIFKVLSSGYGRVNETNVSAFLGYLLNPNSDHGLNAAFLKEILKCFDPNILLTIFNNEKIDEIDLSTRSKYLTEVFLEKNFKNGNRVDIDNRVDIVVKITKRVSLGTTDSDEIFNHNDPIAIFLVEVKVSETSVREIQLIEQYNAGIEKAKNIKGWEGKVYSILIALEGENAGRAFKKLNSNNSLFLTWFSSSKKSIETILKDIISYEQASSIEPIDEYAIHTIKAFLNFIKDKFSSNISTNSERKKYNNFEELLTGKIDPKFKQFIENNREDLNKLCEKYLNEDNTYVSFTKNMVAIKPQKAGKKNHMRFDFKSDNQFEVLCYIFNDNSDIRFLSNFDKQQKDAKSNTRYKSKGTYTLNQLLSDEFFEIFKNIVEINKAVILNDK